MYVDWPAGIIHVEKTDMILIDPGPPREIYQLDTDWFRLALRVLETSTEGRAWLATHAHNTTVSVSGAVLARVIIIINDYQVEFEDDGGAGGQYAVNLVGSNNNISDVTVVNQVSVRSSNSAGLQDLNSLQAASFGGAVALKPSSPYSGEVFPVGTRAFPVNNIADAAAIGTARGINTIVILESTVLGSGTSAPGFRFISDNRKAVMATIDPSIDVTNAVFADIAAEGTLDGGNLFEDCDLYDCTYINGDMIRCGLYGAITLGGSAQASFISCYSEIAGGGPGQWAVVDMGGAGNSLVVRDYHGGLSIQNFTGSGSVSLDFSSGRLDIEATCTAGEIHVRGICEVTDNSGPGCTVYDHTINFSIADLAAEQVLLRKILRNKKITYKAGPDAGYMVIYDDDDVTELFRARIWEDDSGGVPYRGTGLERQDRLEDVP